VVLHLDRDKDLVDSSRYASLNQVREYVWNASSVASLSALAAAAGSLGAINNTVFSSPTDGMASGVVTNQWLGGFGRQVNGSTFFASMLKTYPNSVPSASSDQILDLIQAQSFTLEAWVKSTRQQPAGAINMTSITDAIMSQGVAEPGQGWAWGMMRDQTGGSNTWIAAGTSGVPLTVYSSLFL
jgi:hypothetical protein